MRGLFDRKRPDPEMVQRVKALVTARFALPDTMTLAVAELRCLEHGCPPVETVITARDDAGRVRNWRIEKPISQIVSADLDPLSVPE